MQCNCPGPEQPGPKLDAAEESQKIKRRKEAQTPQWEGEKRVTLLDMQTVH